MSDATQERTTKKSNGAPLDVMTSTSPNHGSDIQKSNAPKMQPPRKASLDNPVKSPKKRRKVNYACIYCRRSHMTCDLERPCTRCIKRNIGHLCHDEPRDPAKRSKTDPGSTNGEKEAPNKLDTAPPDASTQPIEQQLMQNEAGLNLAPPPLPQGRTSSTTSILQPTPISARQVPALAGNSQSYPAFNDWDFASQGQFQDMHALHPSYMFNTSEVGNEYNLLNDFLSNSLLDDGGSFYSGDDMQNFFSDPSFSNTVGTLSNNALFAASQQPTQMLPPSQAAIGNSISRPASGFPINDMAREQYYMTAADPAGTDTAEERMNKLLKAKYDAGLLRPFNYVKGYQRLNQYMEKHLQPSSRQRILRQLNKFRPKFRERMQSLTDIELVLVEMRFERTLMEYDRVFASMAIPACCWRRTGEIFRGNREMAELIHVPIEQLREGKIAIHDIMAEHSLVNYWEKFGAIAFDSSQKAILTGCSLKNPDPNSEDAEFRCCFSFAIRRDTYNIPSLIVGNFLPIKPA